MQSQHQRMKGATHLDAWKPLRFILAIASIATLPATESSAVLIARADATMPRAVVVGALPSATFDICAYSRRGIPPSGPNANSILSLGGIQTSPAPACSGTINVPRFGPAGIVIPYTPLVGVRGAAKPGVSRNDTILSTSNGVVGFAEQDFFSNPPPRPNTVALLAQGISPDDALGGAAGEAIDPFLLPTGNYDYDVTINEVTLQTEDADDFAGVSFFATDSRYSEPLWFLSLVVRGPLDDASNVEIAFGSNPILGLDDNSVMDLVARALVVTGNVATLNSLDLFHTSYPVDRTIEGTVGLNAGVLETSEPSTLALLGIGTLSPNFDHFLTEAFEKTRYSLG